MKIGSKGVFSSMLFVSACGVGSNSNLDIIGGQSEPNNKMARGSYSSTIGIVGFGGGVGSCTASRISSNTYVTAAHCLDKAREGEEINVYASNSRKVTAFVRKIRIHPTWKQIIDGGNSIGSDIALFELAFAVRDEKIVWDGFVTTAPLAFGTFPKKDMPVVIAGFGCEQKTGIGTIGLDCEKSPNFQYMKSAQTKIYEEPLSLINTPQREFKLDASSKKDGVTGFISSGDSGGPVLTLDGRLIGITRSSFVPYYTGDDGWLGTTAHSWVEFPDVKDWIQAALASESKGDSFQEAPRVTVEFLNGDKYIGAIKDGFRSGNGVMFYRDGKVYDGAWLMNARSGYGEQTWPDGSKYTTYKGDWANDLPNGKGTMVFTSGQVYSGMFKDARFDGEGQLSYPDGNVQTGTFSAGKREGLFTLVTGSGQTWKETYSNDVRTSAERIN